MQNKQSLLLRNQIPKDWQKVKLGEVALLNPPVPVRKNENYSYIPMEDLDWNKKFVKPKILKIYKGGAKFIEGDVLFARITPCLENGKIGIATGLKNRMGFGSTEYFIIRGKERISDTDFLYYLCRTYKLRETAINSMLGASGRQRANIDSLETYELEFPDFLEQKRIASILSYFDDKIEVNNKIAKNLEEMAQAIFKEWFVNSEKLKVKSEKLETICDIIYGKDLPTRNLKKYGFPVYGGNGIIGHSDRYLYNEPQVIIGCRGAYSGNIFKTEPKSFVTHNSLILKIKNERDVGINYLFYALKKSNVKSSVTGSAQPQITIAELNQVSIPISNENLIRKFEDIVSVIENYKSKVSKENQKLATLCDLLLPKLMKGEIRV